MLGTFQQSQLRIDIDAKASEIRDSLLVTSKLKQWLFPQQLTGNLPDKLQENVTFTSELGFIKVEHRVAALADNHLRLLLSNGIDGFHEWYWGDRWVQSRLEGISLLPLNLGQTANLLRFRQYVQDSACKVPQS